MEIFVKFVVLLIYHLSICNKNKCTNFIFIGWRVPIKNRSNDLGERILRTYSTPKIKITGDEEERSDGCQYLIKKPHKLN